MSEVKEVKEAVIALAKLGKFIAAASRDGLDIRDVTAIGMKIATDEAFRNAFVAAFEGCAKIPEEIKAIDFAGGMEIALALVNELRGE